MNASGGRLRTLWEARPQRRQPALPPRLRSLYDGDLALPARPSPYVYANFVASADGVASYSLPGRSGGGAISGGDWGDRFTMALLRALADAVIVGRATLSDAGRGALWTPGFTCPAAAPALRRLRRERGQPPAPLLVVVSASGRVPLDYAAFQAPGSRVLVLTSPRGATALAAAGDARLETRSAPRGLWTPAAILRLLGAEFGVRRLLHEGGPTLFSEFLAADAVQELFLSVAPVIAGGGGELPRPGLATAAAFLPGEAPRLRLLSVKSHRALLLLRYRLMRPSRR